MPAAYAQDASGAGYMPETYHVDLGNILESYGLDENERIVTIGLEPELDLQTPLVIMGSDADIIEREGFEIYTSNDPAPLPILEDNVRSFGGASLDAFDLIVIGGPDHNAYTRELLDRGIITYGITDLKMPALVVEEGLLPSGHRVLVIGDVAGYPYHSKDLPLNGILPEKYAATAAVFAGMGLGLAGSVSYVNNFLADIWEKLWKIVYKYILSHLAKLFSRKEAEARKIQVERGKKALVLGFSAKELVAAAACAVLLGVAYDFANRLALLPDNVWLYVCTGGVVVVLHELGHRLIAHRAKVPTEFQFWGLGTIVLMVTAWLFGLAFSSPGRFMMDRKGVSPRSLAKIMLTGPAISLALGALFLPLVYFGGTVGKIGMLGFSMNTAVGVYNLMPFTPMDGKPIYDWSKLRWATLFFPVLIYFLIMTLFVLG